jgi:outer membrane protein OmpA-like peptidoglycan-associated protein
MTIRAGGACLIAFVLAVLPAPARAQYLEYNETQKPVELNLDIINDGAPPVPSAPVGTVEEETMPPIVRGRSASTEKPKLTPPTAAKAAPAEDPPAPAQKIVLKPVFTEEEPAPATAPEKEEAPPAPAVESKPAVKKPAPPVRDAAPEEETPPPLESKPKAPAATTTPAVPLPADLMLEFKGNGCDLTPDLSAKLDNVAKQLGDLKDTRLQVRAYATGEDGNTSSARRISLSRALSVRSYLMDKGIKPNRIDVRALGTETDHGPLDRVDMVFVR